jgi:cell division protein FtsQ
MLTIAAGILLYGFLLSGDYDVSSVTVEGVRLGDPQEVAEASGTFGRPIFELDADAAARRVAVLPYVERVEVRTAFPDRVRIIVIERQPAVVWQSSSRSLLIDRRGNVLREGADPALPSVFIEGGMPAVGETVAPEDVAAVIAVREFLAERLAGLQFTAGQGLVARLADGRVVVFGDAERALRKLAVVSEVLNRPERWAVLDVREPDRPYVR